MTIAEMDVCRIEVFKMNRHIDGITNFLWCGYLVLRECDIKIRVSALGIKLEDTSKQGCHENWRLLVKKLLKPDQLES